MAERIDLAFRWSKIQQLLVGHWPDWEPTDHQAAYWQKRLSPLNFDALERAIYSHVDESNWKAPKLPKILAHFKSQFASHHDHGETTMNAAEDRRIFEQEAAATMAYLRRQSPADLSRTRAFLQRHWISPLFGECDSDDPGKWNEFLRRAVRLELQEKFFSNMGPRTGR